jgi:hypothetical protein
MTTSAFFSRVNTQIFTESTTTTTAALPAFVVHRNDDFQTPKRSGRRIAATAPVHRNGDIPSMLAVTP